MASAPVPLTNVGRGYTIVTQVLPIASTASTTPEQNSSQSPRPQQKFLKGEPKVLGAVQIMNGFTMFFLGFTTITSLQIFVIAGLIFMGSGISFVAGFMALATSNYFNLTANHIRPDPTRSFFMTKTEHTKRFES